MPARKKTTRGRAVEPAALIRNILDGRSVAASKRKLADHADEAVALVLAAIAGSHGRLHPDRRHDAVNDLINVLERIAERDASPLAEALAHDVPAVNAAVWALGHSRSRHAREVLQQLLEHEDSGIRSVAAYHLERQRRGTARGRSATSSKKTTRKPVAKTASRKVSAKKKITRKKR
jgi:hypothetical protein